MTNLLVIRSSALGAASVSNQITEALVGSLAREEPGISVVTRDLGADPVPHLTPVRVGGLVGHVEGAEAAATAALSDTLIEELRAADLIVIASPMYNFGISSTLKAWFDHVLRAGITFRYTATGSEGLLTGKRAVVVEARGGLYSEGPGAALDNQEPHLRTLLGFIGITDMSFLRAEKLAISPDDKAASIAAALAGVDEVAANALGRVPQGT